MNQFCNGCSHFQRGFARTTIMPASMDRCCHPLYGKQLSAIQEHNCVWFEDNPDRIIQRFPASPIDETTLAYLSARINFQLQKLDDEGKVSVLREVCDHIAEVAKMTEPRRAAWIRSCGFTKVNIAWDGAPISTTNSFHPKEDLA